MQRRPFLSLCLTLLCWCLSQGLGMTLANPVAAPDPLTPAFALMREALQQALHLHFTPALEMTRRLEQ